MRMKFKLLVLFLIFFTSGCASSPDAFKNSPWSGIKTILIQDMTNPIIAREDRTGLLVEILAYRLKSLGYNVCYDDKCNYQAKAVVKVLVFTAGISGVGISVGNMSAAESSALARIKFNLLIIDNNTNNNLIGYSWTGGSGSLGAVYGGTYEASLASATDSVINEATHSVPKAKL